MYCGVIEVKIRNKICRSHDSDTEGDTKVMFTLFIVLFSFVSAFHKITN